MTAEEIRKMVDSYTGSLERLKDSGLPATVNAVNGVTNGIMLVALVELTAQFADLNQNISCLRGELGNSFAKFDELNKRLREWQVDTVMMLKYVGDQLKDIALHTTGK